MRFGTALSCILNPRNPKTNHTELRQCLHRDPQFCYWYNSVFQVQKAFYYLQHCLDVGITHYVFCCHPAHFVSDYHIEAEILCIRLYIWITFYQLSQDPCLFGCFFQGSQMHKIALHIQVYLNVWTSKCDLLPWIHCLLHISTAGICKGLSVCKERNSCTIPLSFIYPTIWFSLWNFCWRCCGLDLKLLASGCL